MKNRVPVPRDERAPLPDFVPVPRTCARHDGWTPPRQRAFIEALAETGSVSTACRMVNMTTVGAYLLRRHPQAHEFRRAWEAALDMGVQRLKDEAFDRAMNGQLVPVFVGGKLLGYRRVKSDRLLMFCLRHYGQDAQGKRVTINYFSSKASAGADAAAQPLVEGQQPQAALTHAQASTTTLRTTMTAPAGPAAAERCDIAAATLAAFDGVALDPQAEADILAALEACAERQRTLPLEDDPDESYVSAGEVENPAGYAGELESGLESEDLWVPEERGDSTDGLEK